MDQIIMRDNEVQVSFEFFPPKTEKMEADLWQAVTALAPCAPRFVSVTYGAGGTTRERTHKAVARIANETALNAAAHLTCVGASQTEVLKIAEAYWAAGVRHIVALRGDPPDGSGKFQPHPDGFENAAALTRALKRLAPFEVSVAGYPERHPDSPSDQADLDNLKAKIDAGADRVLTQFFFAPEAFLRFRDRAAAAGIGGEIVPGILPVVNAGQVRKFATACGAAIPPELDRMLEGLDERPEMRPLVAAMVAGTLCQRLYAEGVRQFHFYTLNRAPMTQALCHLLSCQQKDISSAALSGR
ncbi:methylenetetrahydrofolate reductase [NAD(P)H] [Acidocella aminolytica]|nr:methylenetetrahydrofolate reductase [NAD(P)H] [Acidocella aminolytica]GBQ33257.1 5,10-methylenetetrahydrofolate reductase [Acidocella aminolytica 101 = DSM 11237]SHF17525.1 5,10-methylenetetrahydrofolate reductase (NAD(P)) [Acidocella aminolytica 101 = DSM 11237]